MQRNLGRHIQDLERHQTEEPSTDRDMEYNLQPIESAEAENANDFEDFEHGRFEDHQQTENRSGSDNSESFNDDNMTEDIDLQCYVRPEFSSGDESIGSDNDDADETVITQSLHDWAVTYQIPVTALRDLLKILIPVLPNLPKDPRTLMKTPTQYNIIRVCGGEYYHFGLLNGITNKIKNYCSYLPESFCFELQLNIDGLPLFKSTSQQFWPILGMIRNVNCEPFVIGLYSGVKKPSNVREYLSRFIDEYNLLHTNGFELESKRWNIKMHSVICDTPARAFVKCVKSYSGYHGCDKCEQRGSWMGKMTYPEMNANLRTDHSFRRKSDEGHHIGDSPFLEARIGMVSNFPLDYMHLVCLGVMKRILLMWIKGPLCSRVGPRVVDAISDALIALKGKIPCEFARKPRSLSEIDRWKATEHRQFLLYTGPVVLKHLIHTNMYNNFMLFSVAIHFLINERLCMAYNQYAKELLKTFVEHFYNLYGNEMAVYNVHSLIHLADDAKMFDSLENISAFPFENFLQKLKRLVRKPEFALQQVIRRLHEATSVEKDNEIVTSLHREHLEGPLLPLFVGAKQYKKVKTKNFTIRLDEKDSCVQIQGKICVVQNILQTADGIHLIYHKYRSESNFFETPLPSQSLGIKKLSRLGNTFRYATLEHVEAKCVLLPYRDHFVAFPLCDSVW